MILLEIDIHNHVSKKMSQFSRKNTFIKGNA